MYVKEEMGEVLFQEMWVYTVSKITLTLEQNLFVRNLT